MQAKTNEFETLYYDDSLGLVMMCKQCEEDKKKMVTAWGYKPDSSAYNPFLFTINVRSIAEKIGENKLHFKPRRRQLTP